MKFKTIIFAVVLMLVISSMSFAIEFSDMDLEKYPERYAEAIDMLNGKKAINGYPDGTFAPANSVTRAEVVKILTNAFDLKVSGSTITGKYTDVLPTVWYSPYIASATNAGYIKGYEDGTFRPNSPVTYGELITMILRIQDIEVPEAEAGERWDAPYFKVAQERDFFNDFFTNDLVAPALARRDNVALIVYNAMTYKPTEVIKPEPQEKPKKEEIPEITPSNTTQTYYGIVREKTTERGKNFAIIECFNAGKVKVQVIKESAMPKQDALVIFKVKSNGDISFTKEFKPEDINNDYLKIIEIDEELIAFEGTNDMLDLSENKFSLNGKSINMNKMTYFVVEAEPKNKGGYEFTNAEMYNKGQFKFEEDDRLYIDATNKIVIVLKGIEDEAV